MNVISFLVVVFLCLSVISAILISWLSVELKRFDISEFQKTGNPVVFYNSPLETLMYFKYVYNQNYVWIDNVGIVRAFKYIRVLLLLRMVVLAFLLVFLLST